MSQQQAVLNRIWTATLIEELYRQGVRHVCIAPGSRSTPLTLEAAKHPDLTIHTHFDERGLGFLALGIAKVTEQAVAVIVTSGTAVANLLPAVAESNLTRERLILLTADRPVDLIGCGANQAIDQQNVFTHHVTSHLFLPSPTTQVSLNWLLTSLDHTIAQQQQLGGSIHINCPFPEPLYGDDAGQQFASYTETVSAWRCSDSVYSHRFVADRLNLATLPHWQKLVQSKGVIVVGNLDKKNAQAARDFALKLGWPVLCDPQSGVSDKWQSYDIWLRNTDANRMLSQANMIVQFGSQLVSKRLLVWIKQQVLSGCAYALICPQRDNLNPDHLPQTHWQLSATDFVSHYQSGEEQSEHFAWAEALTEAAQKTRACYQPSQALTELDVALSVESLPVSTQLFIGNSMIVRLLDMLVKVPELSVFSNRGASGIDGLVATAAGVIRANSVPTALYLGDTSLLYDLNSLALFSDTETPTVIVVTNNNGGAIFDMLPVPAEHKSSLYQMPHHLNFEHAAAQFGLGYIQPQTPAELNTALSRHLTQGTGALFIEVVTPSDQVSQLIKQIGAQIESASNLC
ncbi:2-succinyl-5-enolpyruvyl-6-hydroxy-3-cyclohexene-1-carboxylic-acid synthase [Vibrio hippocampi]|uniref:2-succinyl-5-enolpyruvyl-6-hydroxy-3-cyclohexene-1-carboxylate synthase n=1 Tax=Vibrio hippocampi TaxID=654686 RepID=A0ABN8DM34_9VIBR|nr:2-succinyl-5-enolpyruvyl-6-hydroxy-3-cyclohexene-1-carboxylic-acid synthase [Vibrio hippocampi]CAH0526587.1 2-succinyl-5-enolpyruvyl-6-hydroxy-3-cyclohexene-1-carboxylate synthase [Vibrio hippocampi]